MTSSTPIFVSQAGQDRFVHALTSGQANGTFLDIGCNHPVVYSNTYALEKRGWTGLLVDNDPNVGPIVTPVRSSPFLYGDATTLDWVKALGDCGLGPLIDYLSFDVDGAGLEALKHLPLSTVRFRVLTVEHDAYRFGDGVRHNMRAILRGQGYELLCPNVMSNGLEFEDWWVDLKAVDAAVAERYRTTEATDWIAIVSR